MQFKIWSALLHDAAVGQHRHERLKSAWRPKGPSTTLLWVGQVLANLDQAGGCWHFPVASESSPIQFIQMTSVGAPFAVNICSNARLPECQPTAPLGHALWEVPHSVPWQLGHSFEAQAPFTRRSCSAQHERREKTAFFTTHYPSTS